MTNTIKAMSDPDAYGAAWERRIAAGMFSPGLLNYMAQLQDPYIRQPETAVEMVKTRMPGLSAEVRPRLTAFGEQIKRPMPAIPFRISTPTTNAVEQELNRLGKFMSFPAKTIKQQKLTADEYNQYLRESGNMAFSVFNKVFDTPAYKNAPDEEKVKIIEKIISKVRETPRQRISFESAQRELQGLRGKRKAEYIKKLPSYTKKRMANQLISAR
jgi:hypothetical protein